MAQKDNMSVVVEQDDAATRLVILLHAYTLGPKSMDHVKSAVLETYSDANIFVPRLPAGTFSFADPSVIATRLVLQITQFWEKKREDGRPGYEEVILVGHSLGGLLARKVYLIACGFGDGAERLAPAPWAGNVERIVLLAAMNRGWSISHHMSLSRTVTWIVGTWVGNVLQYIVRRPLLIFHIRRGAPFLSNLRLQWLALQERSVTTSTDPAKVVQLLGSVDDMVGPEDNIDLVTGSDFIYLDVPFSGHRNVIDMDNNTTEGRGRRERFSFALQACLVDLKREQILPEDSLLPIKRKDVSDVIFVIHGIRDLGYWTQKIARRIIALGKGANRVYESETASYGYFPMLSFLLLPRRQQKVEWLMDKYTEAKAVYPNAEFSYVGHSNGTYLLAKALKLYPLCRFKRVVLAGSVVRSDYNWVDKMSKQRVGGVLNYVASGDWVVAFFPKAFQMLNIQDLGSAGHDGFEDLAQNNQIMYLRGGHGAALEERNWEAIAAFIVNGEVVKPEPLIVKERALWVAVLGSIAPILWLFILAVLMLGGYSIVTAPWHEWIKTACFMGYWMLIWKILTRL